MSAVENDQTAAIAIEIQRRIHHSIVSDSIATTIILNNYIDTDPETMFSIEAISGIVSTHLNYQHPNFVKQPVSVIAQELFSETLMSDITNIREIVSSSITGSINLYGLEVNISGLNPEAVDDIEFVSQLTSGFHEARIARCRGVTANTLKSENPHYFNHVARNQEGAFTFEQDEALFRLVQDPTFRTTRGFSEYPDWGLIAETIAQAYDIEVNPRYLVGKYKRIIEGAIETIGTQHVVEQVSVGNYYKFPEKMDWRGCMDIIDLLIPGHTWSEGDTTRAGIPITVKLIGTPKWNEILHVLRDEYGLIQFDDDSRKLKQLLKSISKAYANRDD
jgi:hypothetical protein